MDARPTLRAFANLLERICQDPIKALDDLPWGTEWKNLPAGPVTATGGPRDEWEKGGLEMIQKAQAHQTVKPTLGLTPQRHSIITSGKAVRVHTVLPETVSIHILNAIKKCGHGYGLTISHIFEAAQVLALVKINKLSKEDRLTSHITWPGAIYTLDGWIIPSCNVRTRFVSSMGHFPISVQCKDILWESQPWERLISVAKSTASQWQEFLAMPHFPHFLAAMVQLNPPLAPGISSNPFSTTFTNLGVIEKFLPKEWKVNSKDDISINVQEMSFGHRLTTANVLTHIWTMGSRIHVQIQGNDMWDKEYLQSYLDEIVDQALNILLVDN